MKRSGIAEELQQLSGRKNGYLRIPLKELAEPEY